MLHGAAAPGVDYSIIRCANEILRVVVDRLVPSEGLSQPLTFGRPAAYRDIAGKSVAAAACVDKMYCMFQVGESGAQQQQQQSSRVER